jgi:hypothetical protein
LTSYNVALYKMHAVESHRVEVAVEALDIDESKAEYIGRRGIEPRDVFEVLWNESFEPHFYVRYNAEKAKNEYSMLGKTQTGRYLRVAIEPVEGGGWRLITAYWRSGRGAEREYERE